MGLSDTLFGSKPDAEERRCGQNRHVFEHQDETSDYTEYRGATCKIVHCKHCPERARMVVDE